ncbi:FAD-dependent thymidylate synthase [Bacillaceae bacterium Marseille-Q3522]|nr:FAD-dependent thymidylate synthase [Bacillaceae bacterium Marseille-Q3522]
MNISLENLPKQDWQKKKETEFDFLNETLTIYSVEPQAKLIAVPAMVGIYHGLSADAVLVKAFEKNYKTPAKPKVVENYGFEQLHAEPIELLSFVYEFIFDRATEAEMNRYRHNSKNYESGRYVNYIKHGLTIVFPDDCVSEAERAAFIEEMVVPDFKAYVKVVINKGKKQEARRRLGFYVAVESVFAINLRSLWHMARQRSHELSPNGREAEPQISKVVTEAVKSIEPYLPRFYDSLIKQIGKGYR